MRGYLNPALGDPLSERGRGGLTFEQATRQVHKNLLPTWRNKKHAETWLSSVERYVLPEFGSRPIDTVQTADVLKVLQPIWTEKHETATRLKQRLAAIFDWAKGAGHYPHENPVSGVKKALPVVKRRPKHLDAMPWQDLPAFIAELGEREGVSTAAMCSSDRPVNHVRAATLSASLMELAMRSKRSSRALALRPGVRPSSFTMAALAPLGRALKLSRSASGKVAKRACPKPRKSSA